MNKSISFKQFIFLVGPITEKDRDLKLLGKPYIKYFDKPNVKGQNPSTLNFLTILLNLAANSGDTTKNVRRVRHGMGDL